MATDSGKYDEETKELMSELDANGVVLMVLGGAAGDGFSAAVEEPLLPVVPAVLRTVADQIESDTQLGN